MGQTLSKDLRSRVIGAVEAGLSQRAAAERFGVGGANAQTTLPPQAMSRNERGTPVSKL